MRATTQSQKSQSGFTLLELSIFFIIAAALVLMIFKGKDLVEAYRLQATIKEYQQYLTATKAFRSKYDYLPGDFPNASRLWPDIQSSTYPTFTGDGDGNGIIDNGAFKNGSGIGWATFFYEGANMWAHLSKEGLISGNYLGAIAQCYDVSGHCSEEGGAYASNKNTGFYITAGVSAPAAVLDTPRPSCDNATSSSGTCQGQPMWIAQTFQYESSKPSWTNKASYFTILNDFRYYGNSGNNQFYSTRCMTALQIDNKIDDAKPYTGNFINGSEYCARCNPSISNCSRDNSTPSDWSYKSPSDIDANQEVPSLFKIEDNEI